MLCPCNSQSSFSDCCEPFVQGKKSASTAESLMRARYTAYTLQNMKFIASSHDPKTRSEFDLEATRRWSESVDWKGLEILRTEGGGPEDKRGLVEFKARYSSDEGEQVHHEISEFKKRKGLWYFSSGKNAEAQPEQRNEPKVGRNDPCPCGSELKYKKCCGK